MRRVRRTHAKFAALNANMNNDEDVYVPPPEALGGDVANDAVDEQPWVPQGSGIEVGAENAAGCIHWMSRKVLEHAGFQGRLFLTHTIRLS
jgi:transcriptional activator SPT7